VHVGAYAIGETTLEFAPGDGRPFYHFALLAPGNRFDAALEWARARVEVLHNTKTGETVFDFSFWDACAFYFHDPAGNIVEVIAHHGIGERDAEGAFAGTELLGLSELGLVGDTLAMAEVLERDLGLEVWDGDAHEFAFVGERAHTLILCPPGRGWLPTGRAAEPHPVEALLAGSREGEALLEGGLHRIRSAQPGRTSPPS
jgi:hypothetical protein